MGRAALIRLAMPNTPHRPPPRRPRAVRLHRRKAVRRGLAATAPLCVVPALLLPPPRGSADRFGWLHFGQHSADGRPRLPADPPVASWPVASLRLTRAPPGPVPA